MDAEDTGPLTLALALPEVHRLSKELCQYCDHAMSDDMGKSTLALLMAASVGVETQQQWIDLTALVWVYFKERANGAK